MIGQAIFIVVFLVLAVMSFFAEQYCFDHHWISPSAGFEVLSIVFATFAFVMIGVLGVQVWS